MNTLLYGSRYKIYGIYGILVHGISTYINIPTLYTLYLPVRDKLDYMYVISRVIYSYEYTLHGYNV